MFSLPCLCSLNHRRHSTLLDLSFRSSTATNFVYEKNIDQSTLVVGMIALSQKLERVVQTLNEHSSIMAELLSALDEPQSTPRTDDEGTASGTDGGPTSERSATATGEVSTPRGSPSPQPEAVSVQPIGTSPSSSRRESLAASKCAPTSAFGATAARTESAANSQISTLCRVLTEIQQYADQADARLGKLTKKLDRHESEIEELRSKIIWAQADSSVQLHHHGFPVHHQLHSAPLQGHSSHRHRHNRCGCNYVTSGVPLSSSGHIPFSFGGGFSMSPAAMIKQQMPQQQQPMPSAIMDQVLAVGASQKPPPVAPDTNASCGVDVGCATPEMVVSSPSAYQQQQQLLTAHKPLVAGMRQQQSVAVDRLRGSRHQNHIMHHFHQQQQQQQHQHQQPLMMMVHGYGGTFYHQHQNNAPSQQQVVIACTSTPSYADTVRNRTMPGSGVNGSSRRTGISSKPASATGSRGHQDNIKPQVGIDTAPSAPSDGASGSDSCCASSISAAGGCHQQRTVGGASGEADDGFVATSDRSCAGGPRSLRSSREHPHHVSGIPLGGTRCVASRQ